MNRKRLLDLFWEFAAETEALHTLYLDSIAGYSVLHERLCAKQESMLQILGDHEYATSEFQDTCSIVYQNLCNRDFVPVSMSPVMKQGAFKDRVKDNGRNYLLLGNQCVVAAYSYWEEYLRIEIGKAIGVLAESAENNEATREVLNRHVSSDFWGDLRHIRNSIVHKNGIASSEVSKCKLLKWFMPGQRIELDYNRMRAIFLEMGRYRNELHSMSLPPSRGIHIPTRNGY